MYGNVFKFIQILIGLRVTQADIDFIRKAKTFFSFTQESRLNFFTDIVLSSQGSIRPTTKNDLEKFYGDDPPCMF